MSSCSPISVLNFLQMSLSSSGSPRTEISFDNFNSQKFEDTIKSYSSRNQILKSSGSPTSYVDNVLNINLGRLKTSSSLNSIFDFSYKKTSLEGSVSQESILNKFPNFNFLNIHNSSSPKDYSAQFNYFDKLEGENEKIKNFIEKRYDWEGNEIKKEIALSGKGDLYFRNIPSLNEQLHVHPSTGFAKLKRAGTYLNNYQAAIFDLLGEKEGGKSGGDNW